MVKKNVVFDIGNVFVRWNPADIVSLSLDSPYPAESIAKTLFGHEIWLDLNRGLMSESEAKRRFQQQFEFHENEMDRLFYYIKATQHPIYGTFELASRLKAAGYNIFALTDNVHEIVAHLKTTYRFWELFEGAIVSAEVGYLKPEPAIYQSLLDTFGLNPADTVFLDDMPHNVEGAEAVGISAIQFTNSERCSRELKKLGLSF